jgi:uncharacterized protein
MHWKPGKPALFSAVLFFCMLAVSVCHAVDIPDTPRDYVVDLAGIVDQGAEGKLNGYLRELEQKTGAQMVVLTIKSLEGESLEDFSITVAHDKWKLGQKGRDNGVLLLVSTGDKKYRLEVGYGLEGALPDSFVGEVGRSYLVPYFKKGDYAGGIYSASLIVVNTIAKDAGVTITGMPTVKRPARSASGKKRSGPFQKVMGFLFIIFLIYMFIRHPRAMITMMLLSSMGGRRGGWGGGGGFGGGGFGGGGGGGFGGGGASGGW